MKPLRLAVDTNVLLDLAEGVEAVLDTLALLDQRLPGNDTLVLPSVLDEPVSVLTFYTNGRFALSAANAQPLRASVARTWLAQGTGKGKPHANPLTFRALASNRIGMGFSLVPPVLECWNHVVLRFPSAISPRREIFNSLTSLSYEWRIFPLVHRANAFGDAL
jgi:hypothetical protein